MTSTGQAIREEMAKRGLVTLAAAVGTSAAGYVSDTLRMKGDSIPSTKYAGSYIRISAGETGPVAAGEDGEQVLCEYVDGANGRLYVTPVLGGALQAGVTYEVWRKGIDPDDVDRCRDAALEEICSVWRWQPLCVLADGDFEASGVTNWADLAGTPTQTKVALAFPSEFARWSLFQDNGAAGDSLASNSLYVRPAQRYYFNIPVQCTVGTARVYVYDNTSGANISLSAMTGDIASDSSYMYATGAGWTFLEGTFTVPSSCYDIELRLYGVGSGDDLYWGPINFHQIDAKRINLPARITTRKRVGSVIYRTGDTWDEFTRHTYPGPVERVSVGAGVQLELGQPLGTSPVFYRERAFFSALSSDYLSVASRIAGDVATTDCPIEYVAAGTVKKLAEMYLVKQSEDAAFWALVLQEAEKDLTSLERTFGPEPEIIHEDRVWPTVRMVRV